MKKNDQHLGPDLAALFIFLLAMAGTFYGFIRILGYILNNYF